ncbi:unnamed protein product [Callosobruchus maculatus]|uniref:Uncharacterized protein n=1 Tax=Callosobruchus maculatus TaxID=64391 RepID=A0A653BQV9_CALMS|nr:unnamed protein product [Callosobruchus maculatus]
MYTTKRPLTSISKGSHNKISTSTKGVETEKANLFNSTFVEPKIVVTGENANLDKESKKTYLTALNYINHFHTYMNNKLKEQNGEHGDTKSSDDHCFKFPEIPNYSLLFPKFLNKTHQIVKDPVDEKPIKKVIKENEAKKIDEKITKNLAKDQEAKIKIDEKPCRDISPEKKPMEFNGFLKYSSVSVKPDIPNDIALPAIPTSDYTVPNNVSEYLFQDVFTSDQTEKQTMIYTQKHIELDKASFSLIDIQPQVMYYPTCKQNESQEVVKKPAGDPERRVNLETSSFSVVNILPQTRFAESNKNIINTNDRHKNIKNVEVTAKAGPATPKRVKEMFEKISKDQHVTVYSDSDSEIMDDEQFELASQFRYPLPRQEGVTRHRKKSIAAAAEKSHPLKLNNKDLPKLNEKILNAIGIFTERGDMRPGIIDVIEQHRLAKSNDRRNKQFRVKRQWDIQIHLQPKQGTDGSSLSSISSSSSIRTETYCHDVEEKKHDSSASF